MSRSRSRNMNFKINLSRSRPNAFKTSSEYAYNFPMTKIRFHCRYDSNLLYCFWDGIFQWLDVHKNTPTNMTIFHTLRTKSVLIFNYKMQTLNNSENNKSGINLGIQWQRRN